MLRFVKKLMNEWWNRIGDAPPGTRNLDVCSIPVFRKRAGLEEYVGNFAPELYVLANTQEGDLQCQILEREWSEGKEAMFQAADRQALAREKEELYKALYRQDGTRKTPFELALIPASADPDKAVRYVTERMEAEYRFRRDRQLPLPAMVSKYRVVPDYLAYLPLVKNETRDLPQWVIKLLDFTDYLIFWPYSKVGIPLNKVPNDGLYLKSPFGQGLKLNINNPADKATAFEKILHYISQWAAIFCTIGLAVSVGCVEWALGVSTPWLLLGVAGATYLANKCGKDFGLFDIAEEVNRAARLLFSRDLILGKFSFSRALETSLYLAAAGFATYFAILGAWGMAFGLPWASLASTVSPGILAAMQMGTASFFAVTAALGGFAGTFATRYFWRWSFNDNRIPFNEPDMQQMQGKVEAITAKRKVMMWLESAPDLTPAEKVEFQQEDGREMLFQFGMAATARPRQGLGPHSGPAPAPAPDLESQAGRQARSRLFPT